MRPPVVREPKALREWRKVVVLEGLMAGLDVKDFASRDEEEAAGYAGLMETIFVHWEDIPLTENYCRN